MFFTCVQVETSYAVLKLNSSIVFLDLGLGLQEIILVPSELNFISTALSVKPINEHSLEFFVAVETSKPVVKSNSKILF